MVLATEAQLTETINIANPKTSMDKTIKIGSGITPTSGECIYHQTVYCSVVYCS